MNQPTDNKQTRSYEAFNQLFTQHYRESVRTATRILHSKEDAEDAVQTAYCSAYQSFSAFRGDSTFNTWITRIVVNACLTELRKRGARREVSVEDFPQSPMLRESRTPEVLYYQRELWSAHSRAMSKLPQSLQRVYVLRVISDLALDAAAGRLAMTEAAAKARFFRARTRVRQTLETVVRRAA